jgi:hypothetical protein
MRIGPAGYPPAGSLLPLRLVADFSGGGRYSRAVDTQLNPGIVLALLLLVGLVLALVLVVVWLLLPFFVLGTNRRLDAILVELRRLNRTVAPQPRVDDFERTQ